MPDREKYIEVLSKTVKEVKEYNDDAPIRISLECIEDILELLKEQDAMLVEHSVFDGMKYGGCPRCNARIDNLVNPKACGYCGQAVKWE